MTTLRFGLVLATLLVASVGCSKKDEGASAASGLRWTPVGYDKLSASCKKALACCEEVAASKGATSAEDFNLKCSGPALWKDDQCKMDLEARVAAFAADGKPVPEACK